MEDSGLGVVSVGHIGGCGLGDSSGGGFVDPPGGGPS